MESADNTKSRNIKYTIIQTNWIFGQKYNCLATPNHSIPCQLEYKCAKIVSPYKKFTEHKTTRPCIILNFTNMNPSRKIRGFQRDTIVLKNTLKTVNCKK